MGWGANSTAPRLPSRRATLGPRITKSQRRFTACRISSRVMRLLLMRHADAGHPDRDRWPDDRDRPLTERGRREHRRVVASLHGGGVILDRLLSSPLRRAVETADIVAAVYSRPDSAEIVEALGEGATVAGL